MMYMYKMHPIKAPKPPEPRHLNFTALARMKSVQGKSNFYIRHGPNSTGFLEISLIF